MMLQLVGRCVAMSLCVLALIACKARRETPVSTVKGDGGELTAEGLVNLVCRIDMPNPNLFITIGTTVRQTISADVPSFDLFVQQPGTVGYDGKQIADISLFALASYTPYNGQAGILIYDGAVDLQREKPTFSIWIQRAANSDGNYPARAWIAAGRFSRPLTDASLICSR